MCVFSKSEHTQFLYICAHTVATYCNTLQHAATCCSIVGTCHTLVQQRPTFSKPQLFVFLPDSHTEACSVCIECVAVCCSVLPCVAVCYRVLPCVAVCCRVLPCVAGCCTVLQGVAVWFSLSIHCNIPTATHCNTLHRIEARTVCLEFTQHTLLAGELNTIFWQKRGTFDRSKGSFFNRGVLCKKVRIFDRKRGTFGKWALT